MNRRNSNARVTDEQLPPEATGLPDLTVSGALSAGRISLKLHANDKDGVLRELVAMVVPPGNHQVAETFFHALKAREDLCSTCVDNGVAIPHSRNAVVGLVERPVIVYGRHPVGIEYGALDGQLVRHFFLLCAPNVREHLQLLARLARMLHDAAFRDHLSVVTSPSEVMELVRRSEPAG
jgi:mannitol/fructose-specific phosphotransferase system IIA component (Ntr-type)